MRSWAGKPITSGHRGATAWPHKNADAAGVSVATLCVAGVVLALGTGGHAQAPAASATGIVAAAQQRLSSGTPDDIQLAAACGSDGPYREVRVFGSGVGIWSRSVQFAVPRDVLAQLLRAFNEAGFENMAAVVGGSGEPGALHRGPRIICQASLSVGTLSKEVVQLEKGTQSKSLWALATAILDLCEARAGSGVTASSLADGLARIVAGQLSPETLDLTIHHRPDRSGSRGSSGWILRVDGGVASADDYGDAAASRRRLSLRLSASEVTDLVRALQRERVAELPGNVYFPDYTDVHIGVLNREHQVQARQFSGMTPETQARGGEQFERLLSAFTALHRRVVESGQPAK